MKHTKKKIDPSQYQEAKEKNYDPATLDAFSDQWERFEKNIHEYDHENKRIFDRLFYHFPWKDLPKDAKGFDMGCGRGRFLKFIAPRVHEMHAVDVSPVAIQNAKKRNSDLNNVIYHNAPVGNHGLEKNSFDFGYSFGVLMCVPDTQAAIKECADLIKTGGPFCLYMYYSLDNRPTWYRMIWKLSDLYRQFICKLPKSLGFILTDLTAIFVYWPLARSAYLFEKMGMDMHNWPLSDYRKTSFSRMRGTSRDRLGTPLEKRFSLKEMTDMMEKAGFDNIKYYDGAPYWCLCGIKK
jgi:SAM-dependent methyltransferase